MHSFGRYWQCSSMQYDEIHCILTIEILHNIHEPAFLYTVFYKLFLSPTGFTFDLCFDFTSHEITPA